MANRMNVLKSAPIAHRQLFVTENNVRIPKTEYTIQDVWNYYHICFLGNGDSMCASQYTTLAAIEKRKQSLLSKIPPLMPADEEILIKLCNHYGVEAILYAIDDFSGGSVESIPAISGLIYHAKEGEATLAAIVRRKDMGI